MSIKFSNEELKAFPKLSLITCGVVIGLKNSDYEGLEGYISDIKYGKDKETENESILDIYVDFEEKEDAPVETTHPHLNGTSISDVICDETELGFKFENEESIFYTTYEGKAVCTECYSPLERVTETQCDDISWNFVDGKYVKETGLSSNGKRCDQCDSVLEDPNEKVFAY